jgi:hypothetical protein
MSSHLRNKHWYSACGMISINIDIRLNDYD